MRDFILSRGGEVKGRFPATSLTMSNGYKYAVQTGTEVELWVVMNSAPPYDRMTHFIQLDTELVGAPTSNTTTVVELKEHIEDVWLVGWPFEVNNRLTPTSETLPVVAGRAVEADEG